MSKKIGIITSTNREGRAGIGVAEWFASKAKTATSQLEFEILDISDLPFLNEKNLPSEQKYETESSKQWSEKVSGFDGFIIVLAEYNHAPPAPIKNALDTLFHEWNRKVVGFVGYGAYGAESSIMNLRGVISYLNMMPIRPSVRINKSYEALDENGIPKDEYVMGDVSKFLEELEWWVNALRNNS